jgi:hypothetical protein
VDASPPLPRDLPGDNLVGSERTFTLALGADETSALLHEVPAAYRAQINDVLLTALAAALAPWTGSPALRVDVESHGRAPLFDDVDLSRTVGWFTSFHPVRLALPHAGSLVDQLRAVRSTLRRVPNHGIGYGLLRYASAGSLPDGLRRDTTVRSASTTSGKRRRTSGRCAGVKRKRYAGRVGLLCRYVRMCSR